HQCLESHGLVAEWGPDDTLTVWCSTQATTGIVGQLAGPLRIPVNKIKCITPYMGGGFGSKFQPGAEGIVAAQLAKKAGKPVKLMLERDEEVTTGGTRPGAGGKVKIAGKDGKIVAWESSTYGSPGAASGAGLNFQLLPYIYEPTIPNVKKDNVVLRVNCFSVRAWRAPG